MARKLSDDEPYRVIATLTPVELWLCAIIVVLLIYLAFLVFD